MYNLCTHRSTLLFSSRLSSIGEWESGSVWTKRREQKRKTVSFYCIFCSFDMHAFFSTNFEKEGERDTLREKKGNRETSFAFASLFVVQQWCSLLTNYTFLPLRIFSFLLDHLPSSSLPTSRSQGAENIVCHALKFFCFKLTHETARMFKLLCRKMHTRAFCSGLISVCEDQCEQISNEERLCNHKALLPSDHFDAGHGKITFLVLYEVREI